MIVMVSWVEERLRSETVREHTAKRMKRSRVWVSHVGDGFIEKGRGS